MRRLVCLFLGHDWGMPYVYVPTFRSCQRCSAIGYVVPD